MSYRELSMIEVKEVLRRREAGQGLREIARDTGLDRKTVRRYVEAAAETPADVTPEVRVQQTVQAVQVRAPQLQSEARQRLEVHRELISTWLKPADKSTRALRLTKAHVLLQRRGVDVTYATLCRWAHDELGWRERKPTVRVDDPDPGQEAQADFGKMGMLFDPTTGKNRQLWCLVVTLTYSRMQFVWPTFEQTTEAVCAGLDAAWAFFEGVPARVLVDNASAMVTSASSTSPRINDAFADYAQARGFFVDTTRVRHPKDKGRVENQVPFVRESWWDGETFVDLDDARRAAEKWCRDVAERIHGTTQRVVREHYESEEKSCMQEAPTEPFDVPLWTIAKVHPDHHINVQRALYSVPTRYIGKTVRVRSDRAIVRIYLGGELIKTHPRQAPGKRATDTNDYPAGTAAYATRSFTNIVERAHKCGESVGHFAERLFDCQLPWTMMRQGYQLLRLCDTFGAAKVNAVCERSLSFDVVDVPRVERMLKAARAVESDAEERGKLRRLPQTPRFARDAGTYSTIETKLENEP
jgi:transposase